MTENENTKNQMNKNNFEMAASNSRISKKSRVFHVFNHCFFHVSSFVYQVFSFFKSNVTEKGGSKYGVQQGIVPFWVPVRRF